MAAYLLYQFAHPGSEVEGSYRCSVYGMDHHGHPVAAVSHLVTIQLKQLEPNMLLEKIHQLEEANGVLEKQLQNKTEETNHQTKQLYEVQTQLHNKTQILDNSNIELHVVKTQLMNTTQTLSNTKVELEDTKHQIDITIHTLTTTNKQIVISQNQLQNITQLLTDHTKKLEETKTQLNNTTHTLADTYILLNPKITQLNQCHSLQLQNDPQFSNHTIYNNHVYALSEKIPLNITTFMHVCENYGGYLVEVNDIGEWNFLTHFITSITGNENQGIYLGGTGHDGNGWTYPSTGNPMTFTDWDINHPIHHRGYDCLMVWSHFSRFGHLHPIKMRNFLCFHDTWHERFICEM